MTGCATVNRGATDYFRIDTVPQGATATTTIETSKSRTARSKNPSLIPIYESCSPTPCAIALPRRSEFIVTLEHPDFQTAELFITNSASSASYTANVAATTAVTAGTVAVTAPAVAAFATGMSQLGVTISNTLIASTANLGTLGLIPFETALGAANSVFVATPTTTSSVVSSAVPPALAITGAMLLTDVATGANVNLYPNPVVLGLAPEGVPVKTDPNVMGFKALLNANEAVDLHCRQGRRTAQCADAKKKLSDIKKDRKERHAIAKKAAKDAMRLEKKRLENEKASGNTEGS
jgi:hypothetical protein